MAQTKPVTEELCFAVQQRIKEEQEKAKPDKNILNTLYRKLYNILLPYTISLSKVYKMGYIVKTHGGIKYNQAGFSSFSGAEHREMISTEAVLLLLAGIFGVKKNADGKPPSYIQSSFAGQIKHKLKEVIYDPKVFGSTEKYQVGSLDSILTTTSKASEYRAESFEKKYLSNSLDIFDDGITEALAKELLERIINTDTADYLNPSQKYLYSILKIKCIEKMVKGDEKAILYILDKYPRLKPQFFSSIFTIYNIIKEL